MATASEKSTHLRYSHYIVYPQNHVQVTQYFAVIFVHFKRGWTLLFKLPWVDVSKVYAILLQPQSCKNYQSINTERLSGLTILLS